MVAYSQYDRVLCLRFESNRAQWILQQYKAVVTQTVGGYCSSIKQLSHRQLVDTAAVLNSCHTDSWWILQQYKAVVTQTVGGYCSIKQLSHTQFGGYCSSIKQLSHRQLVVPRTVDSQKILQPKTVHGCVPVGAAHSTLQLCLRFPM